MLCHSERSEESAFAFVFAFPYIHTKMPVAPFSRFILARGWETKLPVLPMLCHSESSEESAFAFVFAFPYIHTKMPGAPFSRFILARRWETVSLP
jgi:hypothetical protein